ncbi:MAG TPA: outer membrane beta-barrel family protein, partial [Flavisolibacter sp.]|nr:outer membrane beta-barrel family protein [Flavisolibacter sp.]
NQGINLKYKIDSMGSSWTTDLSFTLSPNTADQQFATQFYQPSYPAIAGDGSLKNKLQFFTAQTNLVEKINKDITLETGLKSSLVNYSNSTDYYYQSGSARVKDMVRTGSYNYKENINAAYLQASKNFSGVVLKVGIRMENTNMTGNQIIPKDTSFNIHRTDMFPYVYLSRSLMKIAGYDLKGYLVYRRTITRPAYEYLNPSPRYVDPYLFESGNPTLRPQFTQNLEANISVDERPIFAIGVNNTKDIFTQVVYTIDSSKRVSTRTYDNLGNNKEIYFRALGAIPPGKKYFFVIGVQYNHNFYQGQYENKPLEFKRGSYTIFTYQTFKITPLTQLTLNGFVRFNGQLQFYELSTFGSLNMSLSQQFLKKKMVITLSGNDLFYTNNNHFILKQGSVNASGFRESDSKRFGLTIRYNFGIRKKDENNLFNVDSPEKG